METEGGSRGETEVVEINHTRIETGIQREIFTCATESCQRRGETGGCDARHS